MPNTKAAKKSVRASQPRRLRNKARKSLVKTNIKATEGLIAAGDLGAAEQAASVAVQSLDNAAEKGIIHKNNAARRKSRLMKKLNTAKRET